MENKNAVAVHEWKDDPNCFLRMLNSPAQQRLRYEMRNTAMERKDKKTMRIANEWYREDKMRK